MVKNISYQPPVFSEWLKQVEECIKIQFSIRQDHRPLNFKDAMKSYYEMNYKPEEAIKEYIKNNISDC